MPEAESEKSLDMWGPYKELHASVEAVIARPSTSVPPHFVQLLRKHKQTFLTLLKNPPKSAKSREELKKGASEGIKLADVGQQILAKDLVDEALILSDMYNINELMALDLLCTAQAQMPYHPGLTRGLVAVILYYDGRRSTAAALKALVMARRGFLYSAGCSEELSDFITEYMDELQNEGLLQRILELIDSLDLCKEIELLHQNRALGGAKHHKQIVDMFESLRSDLSMIIFLWSSQSGLTQDMTLRLLQHLKKTQLQADSAGRVDNVTLALTQAILYAVDLSILQKREDTDPVVQEHPLLAEKTFVPALIREMGSISGWATPGLGAVTALAWGLSLATLKQSPQHLHPIDLNDEDEQSVEIALESNVFEFLYRTLFENPAVYRQEFYLLRFHQLLTDFIVLMPQKVREMRTKAEEASRITNMYLSQSLEAPQVSHLFESFLLSIERLYTDDPLGMELSLDFWVAQDTNGIKFNRAQPRQVSLIKFVRKVGESVPSLLFVPYLRMVASLCQSSESAHRCFLMLKEGNPPISWDHFFTSLNRYHSNLHTELPLASDTVYRQRGGSRGITPHEIVGLQAVLQVIRAVAGKNEEARVALCENPTWAPLTVLLGLVGCSVPLALKADLLLALSALARSPSTASTLWQNIEATQIILTVPSTSSYAPRGLKTELEETECRTEEYPLTRALLTLLDTLTDFPIPRLLGAGTRAPGMDPYLNFLVGTVFLKFQQRSYRRTEERWQIAEKSLGILAKLLQCYEPSPQDFVSSPPPGYHLMVNFNTKSELLRLVLQLLDDGIQLLDTYSPFPGKEDLEKTMLRSLELLDTVLLLQPTFLALASNAGGALLLPGLSRMLLGTNPRTGRPDHVLTITKFVRYNSWLPEQAWRATRILVVASAQPGAQAHLVGLFTATTALKTEIRHGFVECLDADPDEGEDGIRTKTKLAILKLIEESINLPLPNIALYLIGFDLTKDTSKTVFQQPGVAQAPRTVLHSLLALLNMGLRARNGDVAVAPSPRLLECTYRLLYKLCSGSRTATPVLRFLRAGPSSFIPRHLSSLPFKQHRESAEKQQMAWILKIAAVEMKICSASKLTSACDNIYNALVGDAIDDEDGTSFSNHRMIDPDSMSSSSLSGKRNDQRFLRLLGLIPFQTEAEARPELEVFDWGDLEGLMARCEIQEDEKLRTIDIKKLHRTLTEEAASVAGRAVSQRRLVLRDIETVCSHAVARNKLRIRAAASLHFLEAWRRITETLFAVAPLTVLNNDYRQELLIDTLHNLLYKVITATQISPDMASLASEVLLMLLVDLRLAQIVEGRETAGMHSDPREVSLRGFAGDARPIDRDANSGELNIMLSTIQANATTLKVILNGILQWIVNSSAVSQKLRANLYGALLNYLYTTCLLEQDETETPGLDTSLRTGDQNLAEQRGLVLRVISGFAEGLADALSHDGTGGHDLTSMLALSCLDVLMRLDGSPTWRNFLSQHGYLRLLVDSLLTADEALMDLCSGDHMRNLRPLYMYECKLALLTRIASSREGALILVEQNAGSVLSAMKVFDVIPKHSVIHTEEFLPSPSERFQQIIFPALDLLDTLITSLGSDNRSCNEGILHFLLCHGDMVTAVLRAAHSHLPLASRLTSLIARSAEASHIEEVQLLGVHSPQLLKSLMLELIPRSLLSEIRGSADFKAASVINVLQIACNLMVYIRVLSASRDPLDCRATEPVLWPGLTEMQGGEGRGGQCPLLGTAVQHLQEAVSHYHKEQSVLTELTRQLAAIPSMTTAEVQELASSRAQATALISDKLTQKKIELDLTTFLIENSMYVTWGHLDFFMLRAFPKPNIGADHRKTSVLNVTAQDISALKSGLVSIFNDNFCKKLIEVREAGSSDRGFLEALVRRIKRLLQFVPVN